MKKQQIQFLSKSSTIACLVFAFIIAGNSPVQAIGSQPPQTDASAVLESRTEVDASCVEQILAQIQNISADDLNNICTVTTVYKAKVESVAPNFLSSRIIAPVDSPVYSRSWGVTVDVSVLSCSSTYSNNGATVVDRENYKVSALANGFPVYWVLAMSELSNYDGSTYARNY